MKFNETQVLKEIKTKLGRTQKVSDRTILDNVKSFMALLPEDSDIELAAFTDKVYPGVASINTNMNDDLGKWFDEHKKNDPDTKRPDPTPAPENEPPSWYKADQERRTQWEKDQEAKLQKLQSEKRSEEIRAKADRAFREKHKDALSHFKRDDKDDERLSSIIKRATASIADDDTVETISERIRGEYNYVTGNDPATYKPSDGDGSGGRGNGGVMQDPALQQWMKDNKVVPKAEIAPAAPETK